MGSSAGRAYATAVRPDGRGVAAQPGRAARRLPRPAVSRHGRPRRFPGGPCTRPGPAAAARSGTPAGRPARLASGRTVPPRTPGAPGREAGPARSRDTRSHVASERMDKRSGDTGRVAPGKCSMPVPRPGVRRRPCLPGAPSRESKLFRHTLRAACNQSRTFVPRLTGGSAPARRSDRRAGEQRIFGDHLLEVG